jgi:hypothetical protein
VACVVLVLATGCTSDDDAGPAPTTEATVPTTVVDRSGIALAAVAGTTTSTVVDTGTAALTGSVRGPAGLLAGATVRVERLVAGHATRTEVVTGADGRFALPGVPGGRYRLRAFLAPWYAQVEPVVEFLRDGEEHTFDLTVEEQSGLVVRADVAPDAPRVGGAVNLVASVRSRAVGADGVVRSVPVPGASVELVGLGRWELRDDSAAVAPTTTSTTTRFGTTTTTTTRRSPSPAAVTDGAGLVRFQLRCRSAGPPGLALRVAFTAAAPPGGPAVTAPASGVETVALQLPDCTDPAAPTSTASSSTSASTGSTSTTTP